jgi:predicted RecA/RadA family phage recombinase
MSKEATLYQESGVFDYTLGADAVVGEVLDIGNGIGVAGTSGSNGDTIAVLVSGIYEMTAKTADTVEVGTLLFWDDSESELTTTSTGNIFAGTARSAKAGAAAGTVQIDINVINAGDMAFNTVTATTFTGSFTLVASGTVDFSEIPTSDPEVAGQVWSNAGVLTVSAG